jgi:hypothetical protein
MIVNIGVQWVGPTAQIGRQDSYIILVRKSEKLIYGRNRSCLNNRRMGLKEVLRLKCRYYWLRIMSNVRL